MGGQVGITNHLHNIKYGNTTFEMGSAVLKNYLKFMRLKYNYSESSLVFPASV